MAASLSISISEELAAKLFVRPEYLEKGASAFWQDMATEWLEAHASPRNSRHVAPGRTIGGETSPTTPNGQAGQKTAS